MRWQTFIYIELWCFVLVPLNSLRAETIISAPASEVSAFEIQSRLAELNARIKAYDVIYESLPDDHDVSRKYLHIEEAASAPSSFFQWPAKGYAFATPEMDPLQQRITINHGVVITEHPFDRSFATSKVETHVPLPGTAPRDILFSVLGWWPISDFKGPGENDRTVVWPDIAKSRHYSVLPTQELVNGHWCHVLVDPSRDKIWVDVSHGCCFLARELLVGDTGRVAGRIDAFDPIEVATGIWAPKAFRSEIFGGDVDATHSIRTQFIIRSIEVNPELHDKFEFRPLPGSIEFIGDQFTQRVAGGAGICLIRWYRA